MKWFDISDRSQATFQFFIGGRGIGKTYSALTHFYEKYKETGKKLLYLRMTQEEMDICASEKGNPYKSLNADKGWNVQFAEGKKFASINICDDENKPVENIGLATCLSHAGKIRGIGGDDIGYIYFDEFCPSEVLARTPVIKKCGYLFSQIYETFNRNREIKGEAPITAYLTANAFEIENDILRVFGVIPLIMRLMENGEKRTTDRARGVYVELCESVEVTNAKKQTALYKAIADMSMRRVALENRFDDYSLHIIRTNPPLGEYVPIWSYTDGEREATCYKHKVLYEYYIKQCLDNGVPKEERYTRKTRGKMLIKYFTDYRFALMDRAIFCDSVDVKMFIDEVLDKNIKL